MEIQWTIIKPEIEDGFLWRYLTMEKFEDLIKSSELYLRRVDKFSDVDEAKLDNSTADRTSLLFNEFTNAEEMQGQLLNMLTSFRTASFVNCWHLNDSENVEMWKEYCTPHGGVVIKTTVDHLIGSILPHDLGPMHFRPVAYGEKDSTERDLRFPLELLNFKGEKYKFENEYRISLMYIKSDRNLEELEEFEEILITPPTESVRLKVDLNLLVQELIISPLTTVENKQRVHDICKWYSNIEPTDSKLLV